MKTYLKKSKMIFSIIIDIFLILIILYLLIFTFFKSSSSLPIQFRIVLSDSMSEVFPSKSLIIVKKVDMNELSKGDIISYLSESDVVSHRIVQVSENYFLTKGDSNQEIDNEPVYQNQVIGKVIGHIKYIGVFFLKLQSKAGKIALILTMIDFWLSKLFLQILFEKEPLKKELAHENSN